MICDSNRKVKHVVGDSVNGRVLLETPQEFSQIVWCRCSCGKQYQIIYKSLLHGKTRTCKACASSHSLQTHGAWAGRKGGKAERLYRIWSTMKWRCSPGDSHDQRRYYGKGIRVCDEWKSDYVIFRDWALASGYTEKLTIDRKNNSLGYSPDNCRWTSWQAQERNRTNNRHITAFGETKLLVEWEEDQRCSVGRSVVGRRITAGWDAERAITQPAGKQALWRKKT